MNEEEEKRIALNPDFDPDAFADENNGITEGGDTGVSETEAVYNPPTIRGEQSPIGFSSVDLSIKENVKKMWEEYGAFSNGITWRTPDEIRNDPARLAAKDAWYQKYYGMDKATYDLRLEEFKNTRTTNIPLYGEVKVGDQGGFYPGANNPLGNLSKNFQRLSTVGMGGPDWIMDGIGNIPGLGVLDDWYDKWTKTDDPLDDQLRRLSSIMIPTMLGGQAITSHLMASKAPMLYKAMYGTGLYAGLDMSVIGLSDIGEEHNMIRVLADTFPNVFGPEGTLPAPDWSKTLDSDSTAVTKWKNMLETGPMSIFGTLLGAVIALKGGKKPLSWLEPKSDSAIAYKQGQLALNSDPDKLIRIQEINTALSAEVLDKATERSLINELLTLQEEVGVLDNLEAVVKNEAKSRKIESLGAAKRKITQAKQLELDLGYDPDVTPGITKDVGEGRVIPPGNTARNMADTTAIKNSTSTGDPAPLITESMRKKGLMVGPTSRGAVMGVAEETRDIGRFNALVDGFRYTSKQMNAAAWDIYTSIIDPGASLDDVKALFLENRDVKNMLLGRFKVETINEEQARAAAFALRDLTDRFLGREITEASARAMDTAGREASTAAEALLRFKDKVDENATMNLIIDKMEFLMDEYALNKYISGWQLRNKNWFDQVPPRDLDTVLERLTTEFTSAENAIHARNKAFTDTLKNLQKEGRTDLLRPLVDAYNHTNGDVDSIMKLNDWARSQVAVLGAIRSPNPKQLNLFAKSLWAVRFNNILSGKSPFSAGIGNTGQLTLSPITQLMGSAIWGITDNFSEIKKTFYYNGAVFETNKRALSDAWSMIKKTWKNPDEMMKAYRKDFALQEEKTWHIMDQMAKVWEEDGNWGNLIQYNISRLLKDISQWKALRTGMTAMVGPDAFANTHKAHFVSRVRAYDDIFSEFGFEDLSKIKLAEAEHYKTMFDERGLPKDPVLKYYAGEISLNLDDATSTYLNKATTAVPITKELLMFPRTQSNWVKNSLSWTPISAIPGMNKYAKTIWANTDESIAAALAEHGIDMATTPNAMAIFKNLRAEYTGRIAFSLLTVKTLEQYAMAGNIRGNGHFNASRRFKEENEMGYIPKTINIGGKWVSYKGIPGVEQILSIVGDMAYYRNDITEDYWESFSSKLAWTISAAFLNDTPFGSLEPLFSFINGDWSGFNRLAANGFRSLIPGSSALKVSADAIDSARKHIENDIISHIQKGIPFAKSLLPDRRDPWTGRLINDVNHPILKVFNALSPNKISDGNEPWRIKLREIGYKGMSKITKDSSGSHEYTPKQLSLIEQYIGEQEPWKDLERILNNPAHAKDIETVIQYRRTGKGNSSDTIEIDIQDMPFMRKINAMIRDKHKIAEKRLILQNPDVAENIIDQRRVNARMREGRIDEAIRIRDENTKRQLLEYGGSR